MDSEKAQYATDNAFATFRYSDFNGYAQDWVLKITNFAQVLYVSPNPADTTCTLHKAITGTCASPLRTLTSDHHIVRAQDIVFNAVMTPKSRKDVLNALVGAKALFLLYLKV